MVDEKTAIAISVVLFLILILLMPERECSKEVHVLVPVPVPVPPAALTPDAGTTDKIQVHRARVIPAGQLVEFWRKWDSCTGEYCID